jgi:hypothetical protein
MPDRPRHTKFEILKIDITPAKCEQFADLIGLRSTHSYRIA